MGGDRHRRAAVGATAETLAEQPVPIPDDHQRRQDEENDRLGDDTSRNDRAPENHCLAIGQRLPHDNHRHADDDEKCDRDRDEKHLASLMERRRDACSRRASRPAVCVEPLRSANEPVKNGVPNVKNETADVKTGSRGVLNRCSDVKNGNRESEKSCR